MILILLFLLLLLLLLFQFTSVYFRNVSFSRLPSTIQVQDKNEVLFDTISAVSE